MTLLSGLLRGPIDPVGARRVVRQAGGDERVLKRLLRDQLADGALQWRFGVWLWTDECADAEADELRFQKIDADCHQLHLLGYHAAAARRIPRLVDQFTDGAYAWHCALAGAARAWAGWDGSVPLLAAAVARLPAAKGHAPELVIALIHAGDVVSAQKCLPQSMSSSAMALLANAHITSALGSVEFAVGEIKSAADVARSKRQFALEVFCLQTLTRFGDGSGAERLALLAGMVDGPRAHLAARHAAALASRNARRLLDAARAYEKADDWLGAIDAAAQSASIQRRTGREFAATARYAARVARFCGWPRTSTLEALCLPTDFE